MATKSKGVGRGKGSGGKRPGAGRKPKSLVKKALSPEVKEQAKARIETLAALPLEENPASARARLAFKTLDDVMINSQFDAPRVTAARAIIELAKEEQARAASAGLGKKEQAKMKAKELAVGKFAAPPPPPSAKRSLQ